MFLQVAFTAFLSWNDVRTRSPADLLNPALMLCFLYFGGTRKPTQRASDTAQQNRAEKAAFCKTSVLFQIQLLHREQSQTQAFLDAQGHG